jgi:two-component system response regulator NreC
MPHRISNVSLRILLADDHQVVRQGLRILLENEGLDVVAEAADGCEAVQLTAACRPDVAVLDLSMPKIDGLSAAKEILRHAPGTRLVMLTMHADHHQVVAALQTGIRGYVLKTQVAHDLVHAIRDVVGGGVYLSPGVSRAVIDAYLDGRKTPADRLGPREREVLRFVAEGETTREIAAALNITVKSAETYRERIMAKLDIHDVAGLVRYAIRRGLIQPSLLMPFGSSLSATCDLLDQLLVCSCDLLEPLLVCSTCFV